MSDEKAAATLAYGGRHDPTLIARVGELLEDGKTHAEIATAVGCSERTIDRVVEECDELAPLRARAGKRLAERLVAEGQDILDAPLPEENAGPEATRAKNRADFRYKRAGAENRAKYGDQVKHEIEAKVLTVALPLSVMLPSTSPALEGGKDIHDPRVLELRAMAQQQRALLPDATKGLLG